jgi:Methyltransferase domain
VQAADWIKEGLTIVGRRTPRDVPRLLNATANFLETGRRLRERGLRIPLRAASRYQLFDIGIQELQTEKPLYLEFGVYRGDVTRYWAARLDSPRARFIGFDSFEGLPEDWTTAAAKGQFSTAGAVPDVADDRVTFVKGWFDESLSCFRLPDHDRLFINVDCDLYSSAVTVLRWAIPHIRPRDLIYLDEFHDRLNEGRAFYEFLDASGYRIEPIGATRGLNHVLFQRVA